MKQESLNNQDSERIQAAKRESLSLMATSISHDFNNLIAAILGNISIIMRNTPADSPLMKNAAQIETTARKALDLTNQLQSYAGKAEFTITLIDINRLIIEIIPSLKDTVHGGISINPSLHQPLPMIKGDNACIRQIIISLLSNASDAILDNAGIIGISTGTIELNLSQDEDIRLDEISRGNKYVYVEVSDTGCGMTAEVRNRIFDPFFTTKLRGQGLGLSTAIGIVRAHGGTIEVNSTPGSGSTFRVMFPVAEN